MRFRIAEKDGKYWVHVKTYDNVIGFFWRKIGKHVDGYGLYFPINYDYPLSEKECLEVIEKFKNWYKNGRVKKGITYTYIEE